MKNYERYQNITGDDYEKRGIMYYICQIPSDKKIIPLLSKIENKKILDVGCGSGFYTKFLTEKNKVTGIDQNPHLCRLSIPLHKGDATQLSQIVGDEKFDMVISTWMTEYLNPEQLSRFFSQARMVLKADGRLMSTVISKNGFGFVYVTAAKMIRGIDKFNYSKKQIINMLKETGFADIEIVDISSRFYIPWAFLAVAKQP